MLISSDFGFEKQSLLRPGFGHKKQHAFLAAYLAAAGGCQAPESALRTESWSVAEGARKRARRFWFMPRGAAQAGLTVGASRSLSCARRKACEVVFEEKARSASGFGLRGHPREELAEKKQVLRCRLLLFLQISAAKNNSGVKPPLFRRADIAIPMLRARKGASLYGMPVRRHAIDFALWVGLPFFPFLDFGICKTRESPLPFRMNSAKLRGVLLFSVVESCGQLVVGSGTEFIGHVVKGADVVAAKECLAFETFVDLQDDVKSPVQVVNRFIQVIFQYSAWATALGLRRRAGAFSFNSSHDLPSSEGDCG